MNLFFSKKHSRPLIQLLDEDNCILHYVNARLFRMKEPPPRVLINKVFQARVKKKLIAALRKLLLSVSMPARVSLVPHPRLSQVFRIALLPLRGSFNWARVAKTDDRSLTLICIYAFPSASSLPLSGIPHPFAQLLSPLPLLTWRSKI